MTSRKDNWGNQELPGISNEELLSEEFAKKVRYSEFGEMNRLRALETEWQEANSEGAKKRVDDPQWQTNHREVLNYINSDPTICQKRLERIQEVTSSDEWREAQLNGIKNVRANNPNWAANISVGHEKLRETDEYWTQRAEVAAKLTNNPKHMQAVKEGVKDRWNKSENLSNCPHCKMVNIDNANYTRHHGNECWIKDKKLIGYNSIGTQIESIDIPNLITQKYNINIIKDRIKNGGKHKKLFWKLEKR